MTKSDNTLSIGKRRSMPKIRFNSFSERILTNLTTAIAAPGKTEATVARESGIPLTTLRRKLASVHAAGSFTVTEVVCLCDVLNDWTAFLDCTDGPSVDGFKEPNIPRLAARQTTSKVSR